jgi:glycosyltransferase involved in cell wall biosynthesis
MTYLIFITNDEVGGAQKQLDWLARDLVRRGNRVRIMSLGFPCDPSGFSPATRAEVDFLRIRKHRPATAVRALRDIRATIRSERPAVVMAFLHHADLLARLAVRSMRSAPPLISCFRNETFGNSVERALLRGTRSVPRLCTANSEAVAESLVRLGQARPETIRVVRNAVWNGGSPVPPTPLHEPAAPFVWGYVGRIEVPKGLDVLIRALAICVDRGQDFRLSVRGDGDFRDAAESLCRSLGVAERVEFLGTQPREHAYRGLDGLIIPSRREGSANVLTEAVMRHLPVVSTTVGDAPEVLADAPSCLAPPDAPEELARAMNHAASAIDRLALEERGRRLQHVRDPAAVADRWNAILAEVRT